MRRFRISIAGLLIGIALFGVGLAALRGASQLWANAMFSLAVGALTVGVLPAVYRRGGRRAFWVGFEHCGWAYLLLALGPWHETFVSQYLITTAILDILYPKVVPAPPPPPATPAPGVNRSIGMGGGGGPVVPADPWELWTRVERGYGGGHQAGAVRLVSPEPFRRIGHSVFCLLIALAGGVLARHLHSTRDEPAGP